MERYKESAIGGGLLGGAIGGGMHPFRGRSRTAPSPPGADKIGSDADPEASKTDTPTGVPGAAASPLGLGWNGQLGVGADGTGGTMVGQGRAMPGDSILPAQASQQVGETFGQPVAAAAAARQAEQQGPTPEDETRSRVQERVGAIAEMDQQAAEYGLKGTAALETFRQLRQALDKGLITDDDFEEHVANLATNRRGLVQKFLKNIVQPSPEELGAQRQNAQQAASGGGAMPLGSTPESAAERRRMRLAAAIEGINGPQSTSQPDVTPEGAAATREQRLAEQRGLAMPMGTTADAASARRATRQSDAIEGIEGVTRTAAEDYTPEGAAATREARQGRHRGDVRPLNVTADAASEKRAERLEAARTASPTPSPSTARPSRLPASAAGASRAPSKNSKEWAAPSRRIARQSRPANAVAPGRET
jgi:hypothetical protein